MTALLALPLRAAEILVGPNVQVSAAHSGDTHFEVLAAADPRDPKKLIVGSFLFPDENTEGSSVVYSSFDGGVTWRPTLAGEELLETSDPALAYGPDGEAYYVASKLPDQGRGQRVMLLFRSPDGGKTWTKLNPFTYTDREYITVDTTGGKYHGRIYVNGNNRIPRGVSDIVMFYSSDGGQTWTGPGKRPGFGQFTANHMGNGVVASDGTFIAVIGETDRATKKPVLSAVTSTDGGETFTPAVTIDELVIGGNRKGARNNVNGQPMLAIDPASPKFRDRLYVVWPDRRAGKSQIFFAWSTDRGATWSKSRAINDNAPTDATDQLMPNVVVNRDGVVGVLWYDRRGHPDNLGWDARFAASFDGGETFQPSVKVSETGTRFDGSMRWTALRPWTQRGVPSTQKVGGQSVSLSLNSFLFMGGDTAGLVATADGVFHPVWVDSRSGTPQVWTSAIRVRSEPGQVAVHTEVAALTDVSSRATLELSQPRFDRGTNILTAVGRLINTSSEALVGPFRVRVTGLTSALGDLSVVAPDHAVDGMGADWAFASAKLNPGAVSEPKILRFKLANVQPFAGEQNRYRVGLLDLTFVVLAANP